MKSKMIRIGLLLIAFALIFMIFEVPVMAIRVPSPLPPPPDVLSVPNYRCDADDVLGIIGIVLVLLAFVISINAIRRFIITRKRLKTSELTEDEIKKEKHVASNKLGGWLLISMLMGGVSWVIAMIQSFGQSVDKPLIYLYPKKKEKVTVKLNREDKLTCTYPKYNEAWEVIAEPDGNLVDLKTGRNLYGLYYEANKMQGSKLAEGFCVKGEETAKFLEEKLEILGLTQREANEFIIYWLPKLEKNKYNLIRFQEIDLINENMPVEIYPKPDTFIRIIMEYKPLREYVELKEQKLITPKRERICCC